MRELRNNFIIVALASILGWSSVFADHGPFQNFFGDYIGETAYEVDGVEYKRDLSASISPVEDGFNVAWKTTTHKPGSKPKEKSYSIDFVSTDREHVYSSAMKADLFGGREALDPMQGDPYVWAKVSEDVLTVYALLVTDDGGYEMLVYKRTLTVDGLDLEFTRLRDNEPLREINAKLIKR
ncbi:MAG: hypothetical protein OER96_02685 [Gammaproteobacteria bacterium]|nr:hypothetical protein [Gammaproteobacteria bacterium]